MGSEVSIGRLTPYELVFGAEGLAEQELLAVAEEAHQSNTALERRDVFASFPRVGVLLAQLMPEDVEPAAIDHYLDILFHCFNFWGAGRPVYAVDAPVVRSLIESPPDLGSAELRVAYRACYIELPRNLFWADVTEAGPPEPVEGMFVRLNPHDLSQEADLLLVLGMRKERQGFSAAPLAASLDEARRLRERDAFRSDIPGADLANLYSLRRSSEVVTLALRLFWYVDVYPESLVRQTGTGGSTGDGVTATGLDHLVVRQVERGRG
jgi:hypothetical protein